MAQRDYISNKNRQIRNGNRRNTSEKQYAGKSPVILIALIVLVLVVFIGGLYFIMNNAPSEEVEKQRQPSTSDLPPPPEERWQYISSLESNSSPVTNNEANVQNLEQEALNALIAQQLGTNPQDSATGLSLPPVQDNTNVASGVMPNSNEAVQPINPTEPATLQPIYTEPLAQTPVTNQTDVGTITQTEATNTTAVTPSTPTATLPQTTITEPASTRSLADEQAELEKKRALARQKELEHQYQLEQQAILKKQEQDRLKAEEIVKQNKKEAERVAQQNRIKEQQSQAQVQVQQPQVAVNNRVNPPVATNAPAAGWQLQCGSFQEPKRADEVKANLAFKGIQSRVVPAGNYNRVMIGPFNNRNQASEAQSRAKAAGAPSCIILAP